VCPTTLNDLSLALDQLGVKKGEVSIVFISVDPERDTPEVLKSYITSFTAPIAGLTGTPAAVAQAAKGYRAYYAKHPRPNGDYDMDHSADIYVMEPQGRYTLSFTHQETPGAIVDRLAQLLS